MPSPLGHALGGAIVGVLAGSGRREPGVDEQKLGVGSRESGVTYSASDNKRLFIICAVAACLPDLDFLWGRHNMETHSVGAALVAGLVTLAVTRGRDVGLAIAVTIAWTSHVLFDWLGSDTTPPLGVMALWPLSREYYFANAFVFEAISRRYWVEGFWRHNILAVLSELVMLAPVLVFVAWMKRRRRV